MSFILVYITHEEESAAKKLTDQLLEEKLIACANIFPISSAYWWEESICREDEWVSLVKTRPSLWKSLQTTVEKLHPYEVPCIMKVEVEANRSYEKWIEEVTADYED